MDLAPPSSLRLSVVLPAFDEEGCVERLIREILSVTRPLAVPFEIVVTNDASRDSTGAILDRLADELPELVVVHHAINCGLSAALATGLERARGEIVVMMDGDEQADPHDIPALLAALQPDVDIVCGYRARRLDDFVKRASSKIGNGFRKLVTGDRVRDAGCTFRATRRDTLREIPVFNGMHRFLPTLYRYQGFRRVEVPVNHRPRTTGVSKFGIGNRMFRGVFDCFAMLWWRRRMLPARRVREEQLASRAEVRGAGSRVSAAR